MGAIRTSANAAVRDYVTTGVPASGGHEPIKSELRATFGLVEDEIDAVEALVNSTNAGRRPVAPARVRSTGNVVIASALEDGDTLNGVTLATGDIVFLGSQTAPAENGLYTVVASGAASRSSYADTAAELDRIEFLILEGTAGAGETWHLPMLAADITVGTTSLTFVQTGQNGLAAPTIIGDRNLFDASAVTPGYEVYNDGTLLVQADSSYSDLIWVRGQAAVTVSGLQVNTEIERFYAFYGEDGTTVVSSGNSIPNTATGKTITVPANAFWFRFSPKQRNPATASYGTAQVEYGGRATAYQSFTERLLTIDSKEVAHDYAPDRQAFLLFGDSITETSNVDADGHAFDSTYRDNWPKVALPLLGVNEAWNYAKSGAHFASHASGLTTNQKFQNQISKAITDTRTADIIVIALGTNDFDNSTGNGGSIVLGDYATAIATAAGSLDRTISLQAMRAGFRDIKAQWPIAKVFVSLPIQRYDYSKESMTSWLADIQSMAGRFGFQVIDAHNDSGISSEIETGTGPDLSDGLHPDASGITKLGYCIAAAIRPHVFY